MSPEFWTNTIWYLLLGIVTLIELTIVLVKTKKRMVALAFYFTLAGINLGIETVLLIFSKAYAYYPMIIKNPPFPLDNELAGNLFSQFSVAATMLLITVLNLRRYWFLIFAGAYGIIEEAFLALGIYKHNWYQTWMTVLGLIILFILAKKMYTKTQKNMKPIFYYINICFALFTFYIILTWCGFILFRLQDFNTALFSDPMISRHFLAVLHFFLLSIPIMFLYFARAGRGWQALGLLIPYLVYYSGYKLNLFVIKEGWFLLVSTISIFGMYFFTFLLDKLYKESFP